MKITKIFPAILLLTLNGCGKFIAQDTASTASTAALNPGESEPGARIIFSDDNFADLNDFALFPSTSHQCLGDVTRVYYVDGPDYMATVAPTPIPFPTPSASDDLLPTNRPAFIRNVSVDITNTYYPTTQSGVLASDVCSSRAIASAPAPSSCADFDRTPAAIPVPTVAPTATPSPTVAPSATPTTTEYFGTNFYRVRDDWCTSQGPTVSPDPEVTKAGVGGVSIDIDRTYLGSSEDLLMVITYHALNENSGASNNPAVGNWPANLLVGGTTQTTNDRTVLKVSLIGTQQSLDTLLQVAQPRPWAYTSPTSFPIYAKEIATLEDPFGSLRTEQVYIPLSQNGLVDRIRIDRIRGSFHLYQVDLYRLGNRSE